MCWRLEVLNKRLWQPNVFILDLSSKFTNIFNVYRVFLNYLRTLLAIFDIENVDEYQ